MFEGQTIGHYRVLSRLGEGGMGVVYLGEDTRLARRVAIKFASVTSDEHHFRSRFLREARALSALNHPHIATVYDYGETDGGAPYIVMELIEGRDLHELIQAGEMGTARAVRVAADVADALAEAHRRGIVHRDIKPSNIMVNERGQVKVLDFGLAKQLPAGLGGAGDAEARTLPVTRTRSGILVGTPLYLSPEQAAGGVVDGRSDLFALSSVLYECLTGYPAFPGATVIEICAAVMHVEPPAPSRLNPDVPPELDRIVLKALAKQPEARYQSAAEFADALRAADTTAPGANAAGRARPAFQTATARARRTLPDELRRPRFSPAFVIAILLALGGVWLGARWLRRATPHTPPPDAQRWYQKGEEALRDGTYYQASKALERAISIDNNFAMAHARLAEAWMELDYANKAEKELLLALAVEPQSALSPLDSAYLRAINRYMAGDLDGATKIYEGIEQQATGRGKLYALIDLGRAYERNDDREKALGIYLRATNLDPQYAAGFLRAGIVYRQRQELDSALSAFEKAESLYEAAGSEEGITEVMYRRGSLYKDKGMMAEARGQLQKALERSKANNNLYQQIKALLQLSAVSATEGNTVEAQASAKTAVGLAQAERMENLATEGLIDLGNSFLYRSKVGEAEGYFKQALELATKDNGRFNRARALLQLASLYLRQDNADGARDYARQALPFFEKGGYRAESWKALTVLGYASDMRGDYEAALRAFEQQLRLAEQVNNPSEMASSHHAIGTIRAHREEYGEALLHFEESYATHNKPGTSFDAAYDLIDKGNMLWRLGLYEKAQAALDQASAIADRPDDSYRPLRLRVGLIRSFIALSRRRLPEALQHSRQVIRLATSEDKNTLIEAKYTLGLTLALSGSKDGVRQLCGEAVEMSKQMGDPQLISGATLALAESLIESGDPGDSLAAARGWLERFGNAGQLDTRWRILLAAARASRDLGDPAQAQQYATGAAAALSDLQRAWGEDSYNSYRARPDVQLYAKELGKFSAALPQN